MDENGAAKVAYATLMNCARVMAKIDAALADAQKAPQPRTAEPAAFAQWHVGEEYDKRMFWIEQHGGPAMNDERQAFESWVNRERPSLWRVVTTYIEHADVHVLTAAWEAWQAARAASPVPAGWKLVVVNEGFDALMSALERAHRKGYMPDAITDDYEGFDYRDATPQPPQGAQQEWQPIETAPKGIEQVLLRVPTRFAKWGSALACQGYWMSKYWVIFNADEAVQRVEPTHWMPLPAPPAQALQEGEPG
jgi:hypothetical protein